jgi:hypothetical protein
MKKNFLSVFCLVFCVFPAGALRAQEGLNFSLQFHAGADLSTGFIQGYQPAPSLGFWLGVSLNNRMDGLWGIDYFTMPGEAITIHMPSPSESVSQKLVQPSDDIVLSINVRWYLDDKWDRIHRRYNTVPYLLAGLGMDFLVDQADRPEGLLFYNASYDNLFGVNLGGGVNFPVSSNWIFYTELLDRMILWQGLTQVFALRAGFRVMLDSEHVDPFRKTD